MSYAAEALQSSIAELRAQADELKTVLRDNTHHVLFAEKRNQELKALVHTQSEVFANQRSEMVRESTRLRTKVKKSKIEWEKEREELTQYERLVSRCKKFELKQRRVGEVEVEEKVAEMKRVRQQQRRDTLHSSLGNFRSRLKTVKTRLADHYRSLITSVLARGAVRAHTCRCRRYRRYATYLTQWVSEPLLRLLAGERRQHMEYMGTSLESKHQMSMAMCQCDAVKALHAFSWGDETAHSRDIAAFWPHRLVEVLSGSKDAEVGTAVIQIYQRYLQELQSL